MKHKGFTLIELLVVISIIGLLSTVVLVSLNSARAKARDARRLADMKQISLALELFFDDNGRYPGTTYEGVVITGEFLGDDNGPIEQALATYMATAPKDPRHDGVTYYYAYDPWHNTDSIPGSCDALGPLGVVISFHQAEGNTSGLRKDTCSGIDMDIGPGDDFNMVFLPGSP